MIIQEKLLALTLLVNSFVLAALEAEDEAGKKQLGYAILASVNIACLLTLLIFA